VASLSHHGLRACAAGALALGLAAGMTPAAQASPVTNTEKRIAAKLNQRIHAEALGTHTSGLVVDATHGRVIWSWRPTTSRMPGSVAKLTTALAAVDRLGYDYTVTTRVVTGATSDEIVLVGGGDELLAGRDLASLAATTANKLLRSGVSSVALRVDDSLFPAPTLAKGWKQDYYPNEVAPVRALIVDQRAVPDTAIDAGNQFKEHLRQDGITVTSVSRKTAPSGATTLASHTSLPLREWLKPLLLNSDADIAEGIFRLLAVDAGYPATWENARSVRNVVLGRRKIKGQVLYDGSGLSRSDRVTAKGMVRLLMVLHHDPTLDDLISYLPTAGKTGTLMASKGRFATRPSSCAKKLVQAKTGSLGDVLALGGVAKGSVGTSRRIFFFVENGEAPAPEAKQAIDGLAATVTGCW
jgi:D-alanyl-D-alanine carboxypeptidase/D-alanyl-D-alanine-endopeptidase (penicillin-binding protein 4)